MNFDEAISKVLEIFPNALFDEMSGEVIISTGMTLKDNKLVDMEIE